MVDVTAPMAGKVVLITGGTGGIGKATAIGLAALGARVAITGRDRERAEAAAAEIRDATGNPLVDAFAADLSSQAEVRRLAAQVLDAYPRLDVLINNVGGFWATRHVTADGLERTFAVNHLAAFLLTDLLLDRLKASAPARVVTVSSGAQSMGSIDFGDLQGERSYSGQTAYNQSKLASVMFTYELARRLEGTRRDGHRAAPWRGQYRVRRRGSVLDLQVHRSARETVHEDAGAGRRDVDLPGVVARGRGRHRAGTSRRSKPQTSNKASYDVDAAARLWQVSAGLVGLASALIPTDDRCSGAGRSGDGHQASAVGGVVSRPSDLTESRTTMWCGSVTPSSAISSPARNRSRLSIPVAPSSWSGIATVVSAGWTAIAVGMSSMPMTLTSWGIA